MFALKKDLVRRLSPIDWMINILDKSTKKNTGTGNVSQIVLELDGKLNVENFVASWMNFLEKNPIVRGRVKRFWNFKPYWVSVNNRVAPKVNVFRFEGGLDLEKLHAVLVDVVNEPFESESQHLELTLLEFADASYCALKFDHRLLDARGAESFLESFNKNEHVSYSDEDEDDCSVLEKLNSAKKINKLVVSFAEKTTAAHLILNKRLKKRKIDFCFADFNDDEVKQIETNVLEKAGYLMYTPYFFAITAKSVDNLFKKLGLQSSHYIVPINIDQRGTDIDAQNVLFNNLSFLLFKVSSDTLDNFSELLEDIKKQFYFCIKEKIAVAMRHAASFLRMMPLWLLSNSKFLSFDGVFSSYSFSYIAEAGYKSDTFIGLKVKNIMHMPRVPTPPGLGIFFTRFNGKLNLVIAYCHDQIKSDLVDQMIKEIHDGLIEKGLG